MLRTSGKGVVATVCNTAVLSYFSNEHWAVYLKFTVILTAHIY